MFKKNPLLMAEDDAGGTGGGSPDVQAQIDAAVSAAVAGLKTKNAELLGSLRDTKDTLKRFDGIDPDAVRNIISKFANDEEAALIAKGEIDKVLNNRTERMKAGFERETQAERAKREAAEARAAKFSKRVLENGIRAEAAAAGLHQYAIEDALLRHQGYQDALAEAEVFADPELVESGMPNEEGGERAMLNLLAKGLPITAVVAYNDAMAAGAISVLADNGLKVPEEVSVVGFDDIIYARYLRPKLSTMRYPIELMAAQAAKLALQLAAGESETVQSRIYTPTLINRHSVAPVRL